MVSDYYVDWSRNAATALRDCGSGGEILLCSEPRVSRVCSRPAHHTVTRPASELGFYSLAL